MDEDDTAVVIDVGSGECKSGFSGDDAPRSVVPSVIGYPRFYHQEIKFDHMVGDEAQECREFLSLHYPIQRGIVTNWDDAEKLFQFCFKDLRVSPKDLPVFMSEPVFNPSGNKEKMLELMFENFAVPAFFSVNSATLNLFNCGRGVGLILDIGEGLTQLAPIYFTSPTPQAILRQEFGGQDVTSYLQKLLHKRGYSFTTSSELEYIREIKEEFCYASLNFSHDFSTQAEETSFSLPDGNKLTIGKEKFQSVECLFQPALMYPEGTNLKSLQEMLENCLENIDIDIRRDFYCNLILAGGTTLIKNFQERIEQVWRKVVPKNMVTRIVAVPERKYSVWIGGSIQSSLATFQEAWIKKAEYEEFGPTIVHRRTLLH